MLDKQGYTHAQACTRPRSRAPAHTHAHAHTDKYVIITAFHGNNGLATAPDCCVTRTLLVFFSVSINDSSRRCNVECRAYLIRMIEEV